MGHRIGTLALFVGVAAIAMVEAPVLAEDAELVKKREQFGQQAFAPEGGFVVERGKRLPLLAWKQPGKVALLSKDASIRTRWFDEELKEVTMAEKAGRYFVYGETMGPGGTTFRQAMTCVCLAPDDDLSALAGKREPGEIDSTLESWRHTEDGAVELAAILESGGKAEPRVGQWQMENATRHVRLKRKLMGLDRKPPVIVSARRLEGQSAPVLRKGSREETGVSSDQVAAVEAKLDAWYAEAKKPTAIVIAKDSVILVEKSYDKLDGEPVTGRYADVAAFRHETPHGNPARHVCRSRVGRPGAADRRFPARFRHPGRPASHLSRRSRAPLRYPLPVVARLFAPLLLPHLA